MEKQGTVYLSGKITNDADYQRKFAIASQKLEAAGYVVLNPAILPSVGLDYSAYMRIGCAMLNECDEICMLPDWRTSNGAMYELGFAAARNIPVFYFDEWLQTKNLRLGH